MRTRSSFSPALSGRRSDAASLDILAEPGMRIELQSLRNALRLAGAVVDDERRQVRFPASLVEATLEQMKASIAAGRKQIVLNGVVASQTPRRCASSSAGDGSSTWTWRSGEVRLPTRQDLVEMVQLGRGAAGGDLRRNPVVYLSEDDGTIEPRMQRSRPRR